MKEIKPIGFPQTFFLFFTTSTIIFLGLYRLIPSLLRNGLPFFSAYLIAFYIPFVLMFALTFLLYRLEGRSFRRTELVSRLRLERLERKDAKIVLGLVCRLPGNVCDAFLFRPHPRRGPVVRAAGFLSFGNQSAESQGRAPVCSWTIP